MAIPKARNFCAFINGSNRHDIMKLWMEEADWLIGQDEVGAHGMEHIQVMMGFKNARSLNAVRTKFQNANIEIVSDPEKMLKYVTDESKRDPNGELYSNGDIPSFTRKVNKTVIDDALKEPNFECAMALIENTDKLFYIQNQKKLHFYFTQKYDSHDIALYKPQDFNIPIFINFTKVLVFIGATGIGKTQFALSHFSKPLHVRDKEDWRRFTTKITGIILDDLDFPSWSPLTFLKLLDIETPITQNVKYGSVRIPSGVPRIICVNHEDLLWPRNIHDETRKACERRMTIHYFFEKLYNNKQIAVVSDVTVHRESGREESVPATSSEVASGETTRDSSDTVSVTCSQFKEIEPGTSSTADGVERLFRHIKVTPEKYKKRKGRLNSE